MRLTFCELLDSRPATEVATRPLAGGVNLPAAELSQRTHELPPRHATIRVAAASEAAEQAVEWLRAHGRRAVSVTDFEYATRMPAGEVGCLWRPNAFLAEVLPQLTPGVALDLACGTGREAVWLAAHGWEVAAVDVLPDALARGRDLARRYYSGTPSVSWIQGDIERPPIRFARRYDLITVFRYLHRPLISRLRDWLKPGGSVLCETFTTQHRERYGRPANDAHVLQPAELPTLFRGFEIRHYSEAWRNRAHTARLWAVCAG